MRRHRQSNSHGNLHCRRCPGADSSRYPAPAAPGPSICAGNGEQATVSGLYSRAKLILLLLLGAVLVWKQVLGWMKSQLQYTPTMPALPLPCQTGLPGFSGERENWPKRMPRQERCRAVWKISLFSPSIFILSLVLSQNMDCGSNDFGIHFWRHDRSNVVVSIAAFISRIPNIVCL